MEKRKIEEVSEFCGVPIDNIFYFIEEEWITPFDDEVPYLDNEDIARIRLIWELRSQFGINDEAMPIVLHLIDQINRMHLEFEKFRIH